MFGLFLVLVTGNASVAEVAKSPWCKAGDWVLDTFQPMVSDQQMIDHLLKNKEAMTRAAELASKQEGLYEGGNAEPGFTNLQNEIGMLALFGRGNWALYPYSKEIVLASHSCLKKASTDADKAICWRNDAASGQHLYTVHLVPKFGKTTSHYFCTARSLNVKEYKYFPGGVPLIQNGFVMEKLIYRDIDATLTSERGAKVVGNLNVNSYGQPSLRQLDARWFIFRN